MSYPQTPNFSDGTAGAAWWKNSYRAIGLNVIGSASGTGVLLSTRAAILNAMRGAAVEDLWVLSPDASTRHTLGEVDISGSSDVKWTPAVIAWIAGMIRKFYGGTLNPLGIPMGAEALAQAIATIAFRTQIVARMNERLTSTAARALHTAIAAEYTAGRVGPATIRGAAWLLSFARDTQNGGRPHDPNTELGEQYTDISEVVIEPETVLPQINTQLPLPGVLASATMLSGGPLEQFLTALAPLAQITWNQESAAGTIEPWTPPVYDTGHGGVSQPNMLRLGVAAVLAGAATYWFSSQKRRKSGSRKKSRRSAAAV